MVKRDEVFKRTENSQFENMRIPEEAIDTIDVDKYVEACLSAGNGVHVHEQEVKERLGKTDSQYFIVGGSLEKRRF